MMIMMSLMYMLDDKNNDDKNNDDEKPAQEWDLRHLPDVRLPPL